MPMQRLGRQALEQSKSGLAQCRRPGLQSESPRLLASRQGGLHLIASLQFILNDDLKTRGLCSESVDV